MRTNFSAAGTLRASPRSSRATRSRSAMWASTLRSTATARPFSSTNARTRPIPPPINIPLRNPRTLYDQVNYWFDPSVFSPEPVGTFGNVKRGFFSGPGFNYTNMSRLQGLSVWVAPTVPATSSSGWRASMSLTTQTSPRPTASSGDGPSAFGPDHLGHYSHGRRRKRRSPAGPRCPDRRKDLFLAVLTENTRAYLLPDAPFLCGGRNSLKPKAVLQLL